MCAIPPLTGGVLVVSSLLQKEIDPVVEELKQETLDIFLGQEKNDFEGGICSLKRESYYHDEINKYIHDFVANNPNVENYVEDTYGNIWFDIKATPDCANYKPIALQAHTDMVWTWDEGQEKLPLHPIPTHDTDKGREVIHTVNYRSSLGADDGVGVATILALTQTNISHGPIRAILTADEEPGMVGATAIQEDSSTPVDGIDYLINLDSENEGEMFVSCAGGYSAEYSCSLNVLTNVPDNTWKFDISGLMGGHPALVMDQNPANGPKVVASALNKIDGCCLMNMTTYQEVGNVIPTQTTATFVAPQSFNESAANALVTKITEQLHSEHPNEKTFTITCERFSSLDTKCISAEDSKIIFQLIDDLCFGYAKDAPEGTRASANLCPFEIDLNSKVFGKDLSFMIFNRAEDQTYLDEKYINYTANIFNAAVTALGQSAGQIDERSKYPAYAYKENDPMRALVEKEYKKLGITVKEEHTMGGFECAWWAKYNPDINQASIGPTIHDCHEVTETLYIDTMYNFLKVIVETLKQMGQF